MKWSASLIGVNRKRLHALPTAQREPLSMGDRCAQSAKVTLDAMTPCPLASSVIHLIVAQDKDGLDVGRTAIREFLPDLVKQTRSAGIIVRHNVNLTR